jgi:putative oxidoreductase
MENLRLCPWFGRILIAALFVPEGFDKLNNFKPTVDFTAQHGLPAPAIAVALAILIELGGGLLLLVGYRVRLVAAAMTVFCLATAFGFHTDFSDMNEKINFFKDIAIAGGTLQMVYFGAGPFSIDNRKR